MKYKLKPYDWQAKELLNTDKERALLCDMGVGKSKCVIEKLRIIYASHGKLLKTLVLGPTGVVFNWKEEFIKNSYIKPNMIEVLNRKPDRVKLLREFICDEYDKPVLDGIVIVNYEAFRNVPLYDLIMQWQPEVLVCDESHVLKSHKTQQSKKVYKIARTAEYRYILTGTPILNSPLDIFQQYKILDLGKTFGSNYYTFVNNYFEDMNAHLRYKPKGYYAKLVPLVEKYDELTEKIFSKGIRVMKSECLDLPERTVKKYDVELNVQQKKIYTELKRDFISFIRDNEDKPRAVVAQLAITKALRLMQLVTGHVTTEDGEVIEVINNPRMAALKELVGQIVPQHKLIIWCSFVNNYKQISKMLQEMGVTHVFITGKQNAKDKQEAISSFRGDVNIQVAIANRRAGGVGINLTEAPYSIVYSRNFSLAEEKQSEDRNYRGGSEMHKQIVKIDLCAKGTIDELCLKALHNKRDISRVIIDIAREL